MIISTIVAISKNNVIGINNEIPWHLPADLQYFKRITSNHHILMGKKCFNSIGRPLPNRTNIVITRSKEFHLDGIIVKHSIQDGIDFAKNRDESEVFIIGGGEIYKQTMHLSSKLYLTEVDIECDGDIYFPTINFDEWVLISTENHTKDDKNKFNYSFKVYQRV
jgi:dihydrofolate reductase